MYKFGPQFDNTYTLVPGKQDGDSEKPSDQNNEIKRYSHPHGDEARALGIPVRRAGEEQGMLFPPEHYTRTKMDPTITIANHSQQIEELFDWGKLTKRDKDDVVRQMRSTTLSLDQFKNPENLPNGIIVKLTERNDVSGGYRNKNPEMRTKEPNELWINPSKELDTHIISHELGHRMHHSAQIANNRSLLSWTELENKKSERFRPLAEGVADAIADRHGSKRTGLGFETPRHSSGLDYRIHPEERVTDLEMEDDYGYGIDFPEWDNRIDKTLYGVTRLHVGLHGEKALETLPSIDQLNWEYNYTKDTPNEYGKTNYRMAKYLALGKMVHENKELETVFDGTPHSKFSGTLSRAANAYRTHLENLSIANETYTPEQKEKHAVFAPYTAAKPGRLNYIRMIPEVEVNQEALPGILESLPKRKMKPIKIDAGDKPAPKPKSKPPTPWRIF